MPLTSRRQVRYMFSQHPRIAKQMVARMKRKSGSKHPLKGLPAKATKRRGR